MIHFDHIVHVKNCMSVSSPQDRQQTTLHIRVACVSFEGNPPCEPASELSYMSVKRLEGRYRILLLIDYFQA